MGNTTENRFDANELKIGENEGNMNTNDYRGSTNNYNHIAKDTDSKYHITLLTSYFLGFFGVHRFINGKIGTGFLMILTCGGCGIWWLIDIITILAGSFKNIEGDLIRSNKPFLKTWSNILVIVIFAFSVLIGTTNAPTLSDIDEDISENDAYNKNEDNSEANNNTSKESSKSNNEEVATTQYRVGEVVNVGDVEYIVNGISTSKTAGDQYLNETAKGTYLIINLTVTNKGNEALTVDSSLFKLLNDKKEYESDSLASMYANEGIGFFLEELNPDLSLTGNVVFDVTDEVIASPSLQLQVQTGFWGTEKEVILLND